MKFIIPITLFLFFILRDAICWRYFPEMTTDTGQWDGANTMTMDFYAIGLFLSYILARYFCTDKKINAIIDVLIGISGADVFDRLILHSTTRTEHDQFTFWSTLIWVLIDYYLPEIKKLYGRFRK